MDQFITLYNQYQHTFNFVFALVGTVAAAHVVLFIFQTVLTNLTGRTKTHLDDKLVKITKKPVYWGVIIGGIYFALLQIEIIAKYQLALIVVVKLLVILLLMGVAIGLSNTLIDWAEHRSGVSKKQTGFLNGVRKIVNALVYFIGVIFILQVFGLAIAPLIASLGIGGLVIALALQPTLSNYFAGLYLVSDGFIQEDDYIELDNGLKGYVVTVGWRNTVIRMWNNNLVMIPNSKIADSTITNYNEPENKMDFIVYTGVDYDSNLKKVERLALKVGRELQKDKRFGVASYKPSVRFYEFGDSNIGMKLILQANKRGNYFLMQHECIKNLKEAFEDAKIHISFPRRSIDIQNLTVEKSSAPKGMSSSRAKPVSKKTKSALSPAKRKAVSKKTVSNKVTKKTKATKKR